MHMQNLELNFYLASYVEFHSLSGSAPDLPIQGQKRFKKESDVGMLLTGIQSTETRCM